MFQFVHIKLLYTKKVEINEVQIRIGQKLNSFKRQLDNFDSKICL